MKCDCIRLTSQNSLNVSVKVWLKSNNGLQRNSKTTRLLCNQINGKKIL